MAWIKQAISSECECVYVCKNKYKTSTSVGWAAFISAIHFDLKKKTQTTRRVFGFSFA